jgi:hypothetical protein
MSAPVVAAQRPVVANMLPRLALLVLSASVVTAQQPVVTNTTSGQVQGLTLSFALGEADVYWRIPFAAPPTGALRFAAPQAAVPWSGVLDVSSNGTAPACPQIDILGEYIYIGQEDCLFLSVIVPRAAAKAARDAGQSLPVMQWIFGGGECCPRIAYNHRGGRLRPTQSTTCSNSNTLSLSHTMLSRPPLSPPLLSISLHSRRLVRIRILQCDEPRPLSWGDCRVRQLPRWAIWVYGPPRPSGRGP